jgi:outer membrane protein/adhesin transport system outer membrane protein
MLLGNMLLRTSLITLGLSLLAFPGQAATLQDALTQAYLHNPQLEAQRQQLKTLDEQVPLAKSGARPSVDLDASVGYSITRSNSIENDTQPRDVGVIANQPLYTGGRIDASISSAEKKVLAGRAQLMLAEQNLFLNVAQTYLDVWRDKAVLRLTRKNEEVLKQELKAATDRLEVGEATRTDKAQAESRYSGATASRIQAEGNLAASRAAYGRIIGGEPEIPDDPEAPKVRFTVTDTLEATVRAALAYHPLIAVSRFTAESAEHDVDIAEGALLPQLSLEASADRGWDQTIVNRSQIDNAIIGARLVIPLYEAGADYARTRAAKHAASQRRVELSDAMDQVRQNAIQAWEQFATARAAITARRKEVEASALAFEGVKQESQVGTRTVLDRLNAEAESLSARVNLVQAEHDQVVAMFAVKAATGDLTAAKLGLALTPYDPEKHYNEVKDAWVGTGPDLVPMPQPQIPQKQTPPVTDKAGNTAK